MNYHYGWVGVQFYALSHIPSFPNKPVYTFRPFASGQGYFVLSIQLLSFLKHVLFSFWSFENFCLKLQRGSPWIFCVLL